MTKLLVVDDSKLARIGVLKALNASTGHWEVLEAGDADTALALAQAEQPAVALLDFNMPGKDGLALASEIRTLYPDIRLAVISANNQHEVVARAKSLGATFLIKPVRAEALAEFLDGEQQGRPPPVDSEVTLDELELDALTELVNLGIGNAAASLREMVQREVLLSVPKVTIISRKEAIANLAQIGARQLVSIHQNFEGDIRGRALLIFPETQSLELVRAIAGSELSLDELVELEQEALAETGNVLLNACLSTIANSLQRPLRISLPEVVHGDGSTFFNLSHRPRDNDCVLFILINFSIRQQDIHGYLAMVLDLPSLITLKRLLGLFIERVTGTHP